MNKLFTKIAALALGAAMVVGVGVSVGSKSNAAQVEASPVTVTLTKTNVVNFSKLSGYDSGAVRTTTGNDWGIKAHNIMRNTKNSPSGSAQGDYIQMQGSSKGNFYNTIAIENIVSITVVKQDTNAIKCYFGNSGQLVSDTASTQATSIQNGGAETSTKPSGAKTMKWTSAMIGEGKTYFALVGGGTHYITSIAIEYKTPAVVTFDGITLSGTYPTTFTQGDTFSHAGMTVTANYTNQDDVDVTSSATFSGYNMSTTGNQTVTVGYTDTTLSVTQTATYSITVNAPKTVSNFELLDGVSSGDTIKVEAQSTDTSVVGTAVYYLLKFSDNSYGAASLSWDNYDGISQVNHFTNEDAGDDNGGYVEPTFTKNGVYTLTLSYSQETPLVISWKVKGFPTFSYIDDTLTPTNISNPSTYTAWSGKTKTISGINSEASYSGYSTGGTAYIQMRAADSGIYTTAKGGKINKVTVVWNSSTIADRHVLVYGSNSAFTAITDMDNSAVNKATGDIYKSDGDTEYSFTSDFAYVGVRVYGGAVYLDSITFEWKVEEESTDTLKSIAVTGNLTKTTYYANQTVNANGLVVTATYEDDDDNEYESDVTSVATWNISYPTALPENEGTQKEVTFEASFTSGETTKTDSVNKTISIAVDYVESLSWGNRGTVDVFAGTTLGDAVDTTKWTFTPTWASKKADTPTWGTGADDVHVGLYDTYDPSTESQTKLTTSSILQASDNGKYLVAFYKGTRTNSNVAISVTKWRSVIEEAYATGTYDFTTITASTTTTMSTDTFSSYYATSSTLAEGTISLAGIFADESGSIKLSSNSTTGAITITYAQSTEISSVTVRAKLYGTDTTKLTVMGNEITSLGSNYVDYSYSVANGDFSATNVFNLHVDANKKRCYIESITIVAGGEQEIGKTADCLGLEEFIDTYLHMSDYSGTEGQAGPGWCKDTEHNYYGKNTETGAKYNFNQLNLHQRTLLSSNSAYTAEWARLSAWATANGESLNGSKELASVVQSTLFGNIELTSGTTIIIIVSVIGVSALGGFLFLRKRKEI